MFLFSLSLALFLDPSFTNDDAINTFSSESLVCLELCSLERIPLGTTTTTIYDLNAFSLSLSLSVSEVLWPC